MVPALSVQPLVENAIKHGVAAQPGGGSVRIQAKSESGRLHILVQDTGPGFSVAPASRDEHAGVGLANVSRRLVLCYGPDAAVRIASDPGGAVVSFVVPCEFAATKR
jgi:sensor histidine kinase YesM